MNQRKDIVARLVDQTYPLWGITLLFYGIGDVATTLVALNVDRATEVGPLAAVVLQYGVLALVPLKLAALVICYLLWRVVPAPYNVGVPLALAVLGVFLTGWNLLVLFLAS